MRHARIRGHARRRASRWATLGLAAATGIGLVAFVPAAAAAPRRAPVPLRVRRGVVEQQGDRDLQRHRRAVDLAAGGYQLEVYFNGATTADAPIALTGTVADGDVFVLAAASAGAAILAQADQTTGASLFNGDDAIVLRRAAPAAGRRLVRPGRRRPGHRVGHRADQHRRQHAAPARRPSPPATPTRPTPSTRPPSGPASPPTPSTGWARTPSTAAARSTRRPC